MYLFSILLGLGAALGLLWTGLKSQGGEATQVMNAGLAAIFGGLLAGRAAYVAAHWYYYQSHRVEIAQIFLGGLAWPGALVGGLLAVAVYAALTGRSVMRMLDALIPLMGMLVISAWLACWLEGCAYGAPSQAWWALPARNEWGVVERRVPVQLIGVLLTLGTMWLLDGLRVRLRMPGQAAMLALSAFGVQVFCLSFLRADGAPAWRGLHLESWAALLLTASSLLIVLVLVLREKMLRTKDEATDLPADRTAKQDL